MYVFTMNASAGSSDSGCEASESDLSSDPESQSHISRNSLETTKSNPRYCGSSTLTDLYSTSIESFDVSQKRSPMIVPIPSSKPYKEFQYTTVTPICYRNTGDTYYSTESSNRSHFSQLGSYGFGKKRTADWEGNTTNISNNDNDNETQGPRWCANNSREQHSVDSTNFDAVVMSCCDEPQQKFYFEQNRFPPGCLDIVLNGNDRCFESDTCSDCFRESGCESDDTMTRCFRSTTMDAGTGDPGSRSWCSLNSFDGCDGLEEILTACSDPVDCFEDELMRDDVRLLPVSLSLQSLSSSVDVDVRCAERIFSVNTALRNSEEEDVEDETMVDMTISAKNCSCSEDDESHYEVGLINNYIHCSDDDGCIDERERVKTSFAACGKADETTTDGKRWIRERDQYVCWGSEVSGKCDWGKTNKRMSKSDLTCAQTNKLRGEKSKQKSLELKKKRSKSTRKAGSKRNRAEVKSSGWSSSSKPSSGMPSSSEYAKTDSERQLISDSSNPQNSETEIQRNFMSLETAHNRSQNVITPTTRATSAPAGMGKKKSTTKRAFRVGTMQLKGIDPRTSYHEPHEAVEESAQASITPVPLADQPIVQADASYHQPDLVVIASSVPSKPIHYDPASLTILSAGEFFGRPFRHIPFVFQLRAIVSYEDDHGIRKNRTTASVAKRYNRAKTKSNPAFVERVKLVPSVRSSRAAVQQSIGEMSPPLSVASINYLDAMIEDGKELVRIPSTEMQYAPSNSQTLLGYVDSVNLPQLVSSQELDQTHPISPPRKQSVSFADMDPAFEDLISMYPSFLLRRTPTEEDELGLLPSVPVPHLRAHVEDDNTLDPSELLARVAAANDRDLERPCHRSDSIGTSVTQVVSRWRKHYLDHDLCYPEQVGNNTWVRSLNSKSIQFNDDVACQTRPTDCTAVETNKIIYYQNTSCVEPTESQFSFSSSSYSSDSEFIDARLPFRRCTDSTPTVPTVSPASCCGCRLHSTSPSSTGGCRRRRVSSADRSVDAMTRIISSSISRRLDEGDRSGSNILYGDSLRSGRPIQREADDLEMFCVEALLASIRSTTKQFMQGVIDNKAVPKQQHQQHQQQQQRQQQQQQQQRQSQWQRQQQQQQQEGLSESILTDYPNSR